MGNSLSIVGIVGGVILVLIVVGFIILITKKTNKKEEKKNLVKWDEELNSLDNKHNKTRNCI